MSQLKHCLLIFIAIGFYGISSAQLVEKKYPDKINWMTLDKAQEEMKKEPKKLFIDIYTSWCGWCKKMDKTTFMDPGIAQYMNKYFYAVKLNAEQKEEIKFNGYTFENKGTGRRPTHDFAISILDGKLSYPTYVVLDEQYKRAKIIPGYKRVPEMEVLLNYFGDDSFTTIEWTDYQRVFTGKKMLPILLKKNTELLLPF